MGTDNTKLNTKARLVLFGGFLGTGKTTLISGIASQLSKMGCNTAVITNDQGSVLVDSAFARSAGIHSTEVTGGCFCCSFDAFLDALKSAGAECGKELIILAEPVGSCTDLAATVLLPLLAFHRDLVKVTAFYTLADLPRVRGTWQEKNLINPETPEETLISHQIKEAATLVLSKCDTGDEDSIREAQEVLAEINPDARIISVSARDQKSVTGLSEEIMKKTAPLKNIRTVDLDYGKYAAAESELGWFNGEWHLSSAGSEVDQTELAAAALDALAENRILDSAPHVKVLITCPSGSIKAGLVAGSPSFDSAGLSDSGADRFNCIINIRAASEPEYLKTIARTAIQQVSVEFGLDSEEIFTQALIPGKPEPTHRIR